MQASVSRCSQSPQSQGILEMMRRTEEQRTEDRRGVNGSASRRPVSSFVSCWTATGVSIWLPNCSNRVSILSSRILDVAAQQKSGRDQCTWSKCRASRRTNGLALSVPVSVDVTMATLASSERSDVSQNIAATFFHAAYQRRSRLAVFPLSSQQFELCF